MVKNIMYNERRWGDLDARKYICIDYKLRKIVKNDNLRDAAYIPNHHEGIVSPAIAKAAHLLASSGKTINCVPNTSIVTSGALKGFISIVPTWKGIDDASLQLVARNVYSDEEYEELESISKIGSGEKHSNVLSVSFDGYEVPYGVYFMNQSTPSLTISYKTISFSKSAHARLGNCKYIELLYHPILKMLAIKETTSDNPFAIQWVDDKGKTKNTLNAQALSASIYKRSEWKSDYNFKFRGITRVRGNSKILLFYLDEPQIIPNKKALTLNENSSAQYIEYKQSEETTAIYNKKMLVSETWTNQDYFGISIQLRRKRDWIVHSISEEDITAEKLLVDNPLIGALPSQNEINAEVSELLNVM